MSLVYLVQSDTTVGSLSKDRDRLNIINNRPKNKGFVKTYDSFKRLDKRVYKRFRRLVRVAKKSSFALDSNFAFRVVKDENHREFLARFGPMFSTSANRSGEGFDEEFAKAKADVIVIEKSGFKQRDSSKLFRLSHSKIRRLR